MYLRETKRKNRDGSVVCYLQLAHSVRHPDAGVPTATVIHNFGRAELVDRAALARLVASTSRFLDPSRRSPPPGTAKWRCSPPQDDVGDPTFALVNAKIRRSVCPPSAEARSGSAMRTWKPPRVSIYTVTSPSRSARTSGPDLYT